MLLHFWDTRNEKTIQEVDGVDFVPRVGETVCFVYTEDMDAGMWQVVEVTWNYFYAPDVPPYADVGLIPYNKRDWDGTADAQLRSSASRN